MSGRVKEGGEKFFEIEIEANKIAGFVRWQAAGAR